MQQVSWIRMVLGIAMLAIAGGPASAATIVCDDCKLHVGIGSTYHFWGSTGGTVLPITLVWDDDRYEAGVFRMAEKQTFYDLHARARRTSAEPYWGLSVSRRWNLVRQPSWRVFFGFGGSYKTEKNELSATHLNFASQLGVRFTPNGSSAVELAMRHWSNAGIKLPNRGQDFITLNYAFSPRLLRVNAAN